MIAAFRGRVDVCELLAELGTDPNLADKVSYAKRLSDLSSKISV